MAGVAWQTLHYIEDDDSDMTFTILKIPKHGHTMPKRR